MFECEKEPSLKHLTKENYGNLREKQYQVLTSKLRLLERVLHLEEGLFARVILLSPTKIELHVAVSLARDFRV